MSGNVDKAAAMLKTGGAKAKATGSKLRALATDPEVQTMAKKAVAEGKKVYKAATTPEAMQFYRQAAEFIKKTRKK
jgi:hypothetical protein